MNFIDLIEKKKHGKAHTKDEIGFIVSSYMSGCVSDAQVAAWLTAVCFKGLSVDETAYLTPLLAAAGIPVAKLADRGLGLSAGTVDKLEAIPNLNTNMSTQAIVNQVNNINAVISSQADDLAPADKKMYILRNEIAAVESDELLASSIISKKIASGASNIIIDVKYGSGAFMKTPEDAVALSRLIVKVGKWLLLWKNLSDALSEIRLK